MAWLVLCSVAAIALIIWVNRSLPRGYKAPTDQPRAPTKPPVPASVPTPSRLSQEAMPKATAVTAPATQSEPAVRLMPLVDRAPPVNAAVTPSPRPIARTAVRWVPFGQEVQLRTTSIRGGGFFFGQPEDSGRALAGCVDPSLPIDIAAPDWTGEQMSYYPQYAYIGPRQRGAYIAWLHSKRDYPKLGIGYVYLFFYGLERRLLIDAPSDPTARAEVPAIMEHLDRLIRTYGSNEGFHRYGEALRALASTIHGLTLPEIDDSESDWSIGLRSRIGLRMRERQPITSQEGFAIARATTPDAQRDKWELVLPELKSLFERRFQRTFAEGLTLPVPKRTIVVDYKWATPDPLPQRFSIDLPDPESLTAPYRPLSNILEGVMLDVEPLRKVRRSKNRTAAAELAATPAELLSTSIPKEFKALRDHLIATLANQPSAQVPLVAVMSGVAIGAEPLTKRAATQLVQTLESLGLGVEPDPRFHGQLVGPNGHIQIFRLTAEAPRQPSPAYTAAQILSQAAIAIAHSGNGIQQSEVDALIVGVERQFALTSAEQLRLQAHVQVLHREHPQISRIEARARLLPEQDRHRFAQVLLEIAAADGHISPAETKLLERFYKALGLDASKVNSDLHHATVQMSRGPRQTGNALSADAIADRLAETQRVQAVLSSIFVDDPMPIQQPNHTTSPSIEPSATQPDSPPVLGVDEAHLAVIRSILDQTTATIPRALLENWCEAHSLLIEGATEVINEASFGIAGEALLEGEDPLELNAYAADLLRARLN